jgi:hypothetical protein
MLQYKDSAKARLDLQRNVTRRERYMGVNKKKQHTTVVTQKQQGSGTPHSVIRKTNSQMDLIKLLGYIWPQDAVRKLHQVIIP